MLSMICWRQQLGTLVCCKMTSSHHRHSIAHSGRDLLATIAPNAARTHDSEFAEHRVGSFRFNDFDIIEIGSTVKMSVSVDRL